MASTSIQELDGHPSLLWVAIPSVLLVSAYFVNNWYKAYKLKHYGIGRGAAGFQTGVKRIRVTPEIAARIRRGEDVSPDEIAAASRRMDEMEQLGISPAVHIEDEKPFIRPASPRSAQGSGADTTASSEWLPESVTNPTKRKKGKRR